MHCVFLVIGFFSNCVKHLSENIFFLLILFIINFFFRTASKIFQTARTQLKNIFTQLKKLFSVLYSSFVFFLCNRCVFSFEV